MQVQRYNKFSAAVLGGAVANVAAAFIPEMSPWIVGAIDTIIVGFLVWLAPRNL